jgi:hypothetical protein
MKVEAKLGLEENTTQDPKQEQEKLFQQWFGFGKRVAWSDEAQVVPGWWGFGI